jgi:hypothetical protein
MANSLTHKGEELALKKSPGSIAYLATAVRLFKGDSAPDKDGTGFNEVADGNGYTTGGQAIDETDWTYSALNSKMTLADQVWNASGGSIENVKGAYLVNAGGDVLAWWELTTAVTLASGDDLTLDDLTIKFV